MASSDDVTAFNESCTQIIVAVFRIVAVHQEPKYSPIRRGTALRLARCLTSIIPARTYLMRTGLHLFQLLSPRVFLVLLAGITIRGP